MKNLDERIRNIVIPTAGIAIKWDELGLSSTVAIEETKELIADYIESIELPEKVEPEPDVIHLDGEVYDYEPYAMGYNACLKDCQAKLDEVVKELRK